MLEISTRLDLVSGKNWAKKVYSFDGIYFKVENKSCYVTNGKCVVKVPFEDEDWDECYDVDSDLFLPVENFNNIRKNSKKHIVLIDSITKNDSGLVTVDYQGKKAVGFETFQDITDEVRYPDVENYWGSATEFVKISFDTKMLKDLNQATNTIDDYIVLGIPIKDGKFSDGPMKVFSATDNIKSVVMPRTLRDERYIYKFKVEEEGSE